MSSTVTVSSVDFILAKTSNSLFPATTILRPFVTMAFFAIASLVKLTFSDYVDFDNAKKDLFQFLGQKLSPNYCTLNSKFSRRSISPVSKYCNGRGRFQSSYETAKSASCRSSELRQRGKLAPEKMPTLSKDMDEQINLAQSGGGVDSYNRNVCHSATIQCGEAG